MPHGKKAASKTPMDAYVDGCRATSISTGHPTRKSRRSSSRPTSRPANASGSRRHSKPCLPSLERTFKSASLNRVALRSGIQDLRTSPRLIIFSWVEDNTETSANALKVLSELAPTIPVIVLAYNNDAELARTAICHGAKGYIPVTMGFEIAIEAVRFVLAGGTYVPMDCLLVSGWPGGAPSQPQTSSLVSARELSVVRAIQQGKSNKVIAYDLNMCESTVKVHVRNIMKKLKAKNRTEVAIKASELLRCTRCVTQHECWSAGRCGNQRVAEAS